MSAKYSIVVPCFNEEQTVRAFFDAIIPVMNGLKEKYEVIFVNDGSRDNTENILAELASENKNVKVVNFARNFGQQAAILAGFSLAEGEAVIDIDVDLQDPVEAIPLMIQKWKEGFDIVHGKRTVRKGETAFKKSTSSIFTKFYKNITGLELPKNCGDFKLFDRKVVDTIVSMPERDRFLRGQTAWVGFKQTSVEFERQKRVAGETKYNVKKLVKLATNGIVSNSSYPLSFSMKTGIFFGVNSLLCFITFIVLACVGIVLPLVAWLFPTIALVTSIFLVLQGLQNIYIARIYSEVQKRPLYIIRDKINFDN